MLHVDLPVDTQVASEISPNNCWTIFIYKMIGCVHQTRQKKEQGIELPVSRTHLAITIRAMVSGRLGAMSRMEVFLHQA